jgi:hypothetical protein
MSSGGDLVRVSDAERDRAVASMREHLAEGRLSLEEFTQRMGEAYAAKTSADLAELERDLPAPQTSSRRSPTRFLLSLFSSTERRGRLRIRGRVICLTLFGNIDLDLRQAALEADVVHIYAFGLFGAIDVYVPEGVELDLHGLAIFGHKRDNGNDLPTPQSPLVRMNAFSLFAGIDAWSVPVAWADRGFGEIIRGIRRGEHKELEA